MESPPAERARAALATLHGSLKQLRLHRASAYDVAVRAVAEAAGAAAECGPLAAVRINALQPVLQELNRETPVSRWAWLGQEIEAALGLAGETRWPPAPAVEQCANASCDRPLDPKTLIRLPVRLSDGSRGTLCLHPECARRLTEFMGEKVKLSAVPY